MANIAPNHSPAYGKSQRRLTESNSTQNDIQLIKNCQYQQTQFLALLRGT